MSIAPQGATFNSSQKTISWTPTKEEIGKNLFKIEVTDSIETAIQEFSVFVNDKPNIISPDSLSIMLGDTLFHYFDAQDLNQDSELLYKDEEILDVLPREEIESLFDINKILINIEKIYERLGI